MRLLLIGDIVGKPGRHIVSKALAGLVRSHGLDLVVANAENAAGGSGLTPANYRELVHAGTAQQLLERHQVGVEPVEPFPDPLRALRPGPRVVPDVQREHAQGHASTACLRASSQSPTSG